MQKARKAEGTLDDHSDEQILFIKKLQQELAGPLAKFPDLNTTWCLLRYARACQFNFPKTKTMLLNFFAFRENANYERIAKLQPKDFQGIMENYARSCCGFDREGRLLIVERISHCNTQKIFASVSDKDLEDFFINLYERIIHIQLPLLSKFHKKRVDEVFLVIDLNNVNITKVFDSKFKALLKFASKMGEEYYPEQLGHSFIINAPWLFKGIWSIVRVWLNEKTRSRFHLESDNALPKLAKYFDVKQLPKYLGGESPDPPGEPEQCWTEGMKESFERQSFFLKDRSPEYEYFYTPEERSKIEKEKNQQTGEKNSEEKIVVQEEINSTEKAQERKTFIVETEEDLPEKKEKTAEKIDETNENSKNDVKEEKIKNTDENDNEKIDEVDTNIATINTSDKESEDAKLKVAGDSSDEEHFFDQVEPIEKTESQIAFIESANEIEEQEKKEVELNEKKENDADFSKKNKLHEENENENKKGD